MKKAIVKASLHSLRSLWRFVVLLGLGQPHGCLGHNGQKSMMAMFSPAGRILVHQNHSAASNGPNSFADMGTPEHSMGVLGAHKPPKKSQNSSKNKENDCDSVKDLMQSMIDQEQFAMLVAQGVAGICFLLSLCLCSCVVGTRVPPRAPRYWKYRPVNPFTDNFQEEVDVTKEFGPQVQQLLDMTTVPDSMGRGRDGAWATHRGFKVVKVTRIENGKQWSQFVHYKNRIAPVATTLNRMHSAWKGFAMKTLESIQGWHAERENDPLVGSFLKSLNLDASRNERLLFHGSPSAGARHSSGEVLFQTIETSPCYAIKCCGFDDRLGNVKGMYGSGTYFADMASKADQYAGRYNLDGHPHGSCGEKAVMFLSRVVLGCPYMTDQSLEQLRRPPCIHGHFDLNLRWNEDVVSGRPWREKGLQFQICDHLRFDSVSAGFCVDGQTKLFQEFVVYAKQAYPEFCVTYERVPFPNAVTQQMELGKKAGKGTGKG